MNILPASLLPLLLLAPVADGWLGVYLDPDRDEAVVAEAMPGSPAAKAGLQAGDVMLAVGDTLTPTRDAFVAAIRATKAGDSVRLKIRRGKDESVVVVKLGERPADGVAAPAKPQPGTRPAAPSKPAVEVAPIEPVSPAGKKAYLGLALRATDKGLAIDRIVPAGPSDGSGFVVGDVVTSVAERPVASLAELDKVLSSLVPGRQVAVGVVGEQGTRSVMLTLGGRDDGAPRAAARALTPDGARPVPMSKDDVPPPMPAKPAKPAKVKPAAGEMDLEAEIEALRAELRELRHQLEQLKKQGRE